MKWILLFCLLIGTLARADESTESPESTVSTLEPTVSTLEPTVSTNEPTVTTLEPTVSTLEPTISTESPELTESPEDGELPLAEQCNPQLCQLPDCRCSSTNIPGGLRPRDTPQFVTLTFDDAVNVVNIETYRSLIYNRVNKNNCPIGTTFYVSHEYTNYQLVNELYNRGCEIALHSISHQTNQAYWAQATYEDMVREFADQKTLMSRFANIPVEEFKGMRIPFLQLTGNASFTVMKNHNILYDSSWPTVTFTNPGLWPYTLDYASTQDCPIQPCPSASIPGVWVTPLVSWQDLQGFPCSFVDACVFFPDRQDEEAWFQFILTNFERHYLGTRAPFGFYIHEWYLSTYPAVQRALVRFMDLISTLDDVFMVNESEVVEWARDPIPINEYIQKPCRTFPSTMCQASTCQLKAEHNENEYWMTVCSTCPNNYPWLGNPLGE